MVTDKNFWNSALMRAIKTFFQVIGGVWTAGQLITEINWKVTLISAVSAAVYSMIMSIIGGLPEVECKNKLAIALDYYDTNLENAEEIDDSEEEGDMDE